MIRHSPTHIIPHIFILPLLLLCFSITRAQQSDTIPLRDSLAATSQADSATKVRVDTLVRKTLTGIASYYGNKFQGRKTASGEIFSQKKLTAACNKLPLGTRIRVTNLSNGRSVVVKVNDRLHPRMKRLVDLSRIAAEKLDFIRKGITRVKVEVLAL